MLKLAKKLFVIGIVSVFMISVVSATVYAVSTPSEEKVVEFKEKKVTSYKIKWSANGGKIGTKKTVTTTVKKGAKVKLAKTPKKAGYSFQGWYTKKSGGKKITKNTKPTKSVTYFAHWKKARVLNTEEKKLVGSWGTGSSTTGYNQLVSVSISGNIINTVEKWKDGSSNYRSIVFHSNGVYKTYSLAVGSIFTNGGSYISGTGTWSVPKKGTVLIKNQVNKIYFMDGTSETQEKNDFTVEYSFGPAFNGEGYGLLWKEYLINGQFFEKFA